MLFIKFIKVYFFFLGCVYCNKWQEAQIFEFVPQNSKTIELKEKAEKTNLDLISPIDHKSPITTPNSSENITLNQNTTVDSSEIHKDISQNYSRESFKQENIVDTKINFPETESELSKTSNQKYVKDIKRKLGFLQMRIDSTIYFDNMGYSYQIQNEKNDKK